MFVGLSRTVCLYTFYMTVYLVIFLPKRPYTHRMCIYAHTVYVYMVLANLIGLELLF